MPTLIPLVDGVEEIEAVTIIDVLRRAGTEVRAVAMGDRVQIVGSRGIRLSADEPWSLDDALNCEMLVLPGGGPGTKLLASEQPLLDCIRRRVAEGRWVAAICAAPLVLHAAGVLEGRTITCYPGMETRIPEARYRSDVAVIRDPPLITSRGPATAMAFALELVETLHGKATRDEVARGLLLAPS